MTTITDAPVTRDVDTFGEHVFNAANSALEIMTCYIGDRLGWYRALAEASATPDELAERTGTHPRYAREWLEQQATVGWVEAEAEGDTHRYTLPPAAAEVLTDEHSLMYLAPLARMLGVFTQIPDLLQAYRTGGGVSWEAFGADARESQADMNRPWFEHQLPIELRQTEQIDRVLSLPDTRVAEIGFGGGWAAIAIARTYPHLTVDGYEVDEPSVELARRNAAEAGVADRVRFHLANGNSVDGTYDAIFAFECIHDMPQPIDVLAAARRAVADDGIVVVMDEATADVFDPPGDEVERLLYGLSMLICLPDGMSHQPSVGTGTVIRPSTLRGYAQEAGFSDIEVLPITDFGFWRFYQLTI
jgi:2-polyprenyl-3-methyl-5-hydroxy-6-metoxy-1,4-benzoquinol methylase